MRQSGSKLAELLEKRWVSSSRTEGSRNTGSRGGGESEPTASNKDDFAILLFLKLAYFDEVVVRMIGPHAADKFVEQEIFDFE